MLCEVLRDDALAAVAEQPQRRRVGLGHQKRLRQHAGICQTPGGHDLFIGAVVDHRLDRIGHHQTNEPTLNVLILCTHNSARSILAEALLNDMGKGEFKAYSAGSSPRENQQPNPLGLLALQHAGVSIEGLRSKSWDEFASPDAPKMDLIITVCDNAAGEVCPIWPGHPATAHWGYADPSEGDGSDAEKLEAFRLSMGDNWSAALESDPVLKLIEQAAKAILRMVFGGHRIGHAIPDPARHIGVKARQDQRTLGQGHHGGHEGGCRSP